MAKRKKEMPQENDMEESGFIVLNTAAPKQSESAVQITTDQIAERAMEKAVREYNWDNKLYSVILDNKGSVTNPTSEYIDTLADYPQDDINKTLQIIRIISRMVNIDDVIGKTVEAVKVNINTDYRLSYKTEDGRNKSKKLKDAQTLIADFNDEIKIKRLIRERVPQTYQDGTVIMYLRNEQENSWSVDIYPLGVALIAPYLIGGEPVVLIDMNELKSRLQKSGFKTRSGKDMFFPTIEKEIERNYPASVYQAFKNKEPYAQLDVRYTGVVRIGNGDRKYGISPIFRALNPSLILQSFYRSDELNSKARAKKILFQNFKKEVLGQNFDKNPTKEMALSHKELLTAYKQSGSVVYTGTGWVDDLKYVEPKSDLIDTKTIAYHLNREMTTLGITFLSSESANQSVSTATISLEQLMKTINSISEQFEEIFKKWYENILQDRGFDPSYAPSIKILDSEALEFALKKELATFLFSVLNLSMKTTLEILGYDLTEEISRRNEENSRKLEEIFTPRASQYTSSGTVAPEKEIGRPKSDEETDKTQYDKTYNENAR